MDLEVTRVDLNADSDIIFARQWARQNARALGFGQTDQTRIATAVSELARQALAHQGQGRVCFAVVTAGTRRGLECTCLGCAPAPDATDETHEAFLAARRLVDDLELQTDEARKVTVVMRMWLPYRGIIRD